VRSGFAARSAAADGGGSACRIWNRELIRSGSAAVENQQSDCSREKNQMLGQLDNVILGKAGRNPQRCADGEEQQMRASPMGR
jgi:hypothetical protein